LIVPHVQVIPILRAGLVLLEQSATLLPASETYHLGYVRDDETLKVSGASSSSSSSTGQGLRAWVALMMYFHIPQQWLNTNETPDVSTLQLHQKLLVCESACHAC
jgi:uracil phosphoribosyltransferase